MKKSNERKSNLLKGFSALAAGTLLLGLNAQAETTTNATDLFSYNDLGNGANLRSDLIQKNTLDMKHFDANNLKGIEASCGGKESGDKKNEGTCGGDKKKSDAKNQSGDKKMEGSCGGDKKSEGSCGGDKKENKSKTNEEHSGDKKMEGSCGGDKKSEGSCGGDKKSEGSCGGL
jgi:hypothetical protein